MRSLRFLVILSFAVIGTGPAFGQVSVEIVRPASVSPGAVQGEMMTFAIGRLKQALTQAGYPHALVNVSSRGAPGAPQSYSIQRRGTRITLTCGDARGVMYGILRLAEEVKLGTPPGAVRDESQKPFVQIRAFKFNLPLPGTLYLSHRSLNHNQWFWSLDYWREFLDELAMDRFNALEFWSAEPWGQMVSLKKFPEATSLSPAAIDRHIQFFKTLFHMAKVRGINTYLVTWNIDLDPAFARAHHIPRFNYDSPLVREYLRDCIRTTLTTYPDLTGLGTTQGEQMNVVPEDKRGDWVANVYFRAIRESGRKDVPFIFRYWGGTPADTEKAAAQYTLGPVYLDIKYNGEDVYSSPLYHVQNSAWLTQRHNYKFLWHLRNDALFTFRWGDPEFVSELMRDMKATNPAGFTYGSEENIPGPENFDTPAALARRPWPYEFQKQWFLFALWGRLGYNPGLSDELWRKYFRYEYGSAGDALYDCTVAAGRVAPLITSYHWNYMNGDWTPEGSIGSWNTSSEQPRSNYRRFEMYHNILDYIFNNTIDGDYENIVQYAARVLAGAHSLRNAASPLDVANDLEQDGRSALGAASIPAPGAAYEDRFQAAQSDDEAYGRLALYYAEKLRGAADLGLFIFSGKNVYQTAAIAHLKGARAEWRQLVAITEKHYLPREIWQMGDFHWNMYRSAVEHDIEIAQSVRPVVTAARKWQVLVPPSRGNVGSIPVWRTITVREEKAFGRAGFFSWLLYSNSLFNSDMKRPASDSTYRGLFQWRQNLPSAPSGQEWVLEIPYSKAVVAFNGHLVKLSATPGARIQHTFAFRVGYLVYPLGPKGTVRAQLSPGIIPAITAVASPSDAPIDLSVAAAEVSAPLTKTSDGVLVMPATEGPPVPTPSGVRPEVDPAASALFHFRLAAPGFYRVQCRILRGTQNRFDGAFFAVDQFNGVDNSLFPGNLHFGMMPAKPPPGWQLARERWAIPLGAGEHTLRIYVRQPGEQLKQVQLVPALGSLTG